MRVFNHALQPSWMGLLAAALLGTSTVRAVELDLDDGGKRFTFLPVYAQRLIQLKILSKKQPEISPPT
jgi:hypothetical protein